ncbi:MAG TPA: hypothetical protein VMW94_10355 [Actinomycetes bacterium]|nr:hypothetical protein [Actinomycetes bacterium]
MAKMTTEERQSRLIGRRRAKIVMNKAGVDALFAGMADGLAELGEKIIAEAAAKAPRDAAAAAAAGRPMLKDTGSVVVWGQGKLVVGSGDRKASAQKPRGLKTPKDQVVMIAGFGSFVAHFNELGTVHMPARPFLTPAILANVPGAGKYVSGAISRYAASAGDRATRGAAIGASRAAKAGGQ